MRIKPALNLDMSEYKIIFDYLSKTNYHFLGLYLYRYRGNRSGEGCYHWQLDCWTGQHHDCRFPLASIQERQRSWFCCNDFGYGLHEDALASTVGALTLFRGTAPCQETHVNEAA